MQQLKNNEARPKFTGCYKKSVYFSLSCAVLIMVGKFITNIQNFEKPFTIRNYITKLACFLLVKETNKYKSIINIINITVVILFCAKTKKQKGLSNFNGYPRFLCGTRKS